MRMWGPVQVLDQTEEEAIHRTMLRTLAEVGCVVQNQEILERLAGLGGQIDLSAERVTFPAETVEAFIANSEEFDWQSVKPTINGYCSPYAGYYLNPETDRHEAWTIPTLLRYLKVAHYLPHTHGAISYVFPLEGIDPEGLVPFFHYLALKFTGRSAISLNNLRWCQPVLEMCEAAAAEWELPIAEVLKGHLHLISPLKLGREEARIYAFLAERGIRLDIAHMTSAGGTAPVTLAGALAVHLAQGLLINMIHRAYFGQRRLMLGCIISPLDMRTAIYPYGRPEKAICNVAMAQMARRYGAEYRGHCGQCDAKRPSVEAGFQRALTALPTLMACGKASITCGLLSIDEVHSPIQMIIDDEMVSALRHFARGFEVNEETLAFSDLKAVGPGGNFLATDHTAGHFRSELWEPHVFSREMFIGWQRDGGKLDVDLAAEIYHDLIQREPLPTHLSGALESELLGIIHQATGAELERVPPE